MAIPAEPTPSQFEYINGFEEELVRGDLIEIVAATGQEAIRPLLELVKCVLNSFEGSCLLIDCFSGVSNCALRKAFEVGGPEDCQDRLLLACPHNFTDMLALLNLPLLTKRGVSSLAIFGLENLVHLSRQREKDDHFLKLSEAINSLSRAGLTILETTQEGDSLRERLRTGMSARLLFHQNKLKVTKTIFR